MKKPMSPLTPLYHNDHPRPVTRRELLGQGFLGISASVMMPSLLSSLVSQQALGAELECPVATKDASAIPFLCFDLAGGANIPGSNVMVGKQGGQMDFLESYTTLGLPTGMHPKNSGQVNTDLGLAFHADSAILRGILSVTTPETRANMDGVIFCAASGDDTGNNPLNPMYWILKAGAAGELVSLIGTRNSATGGNSTAPASSIDPASRPALVSRPQDVLGLVNPGKLATLLSTADVERIMKATQKMSSGQLARFQEQDMPSQIKTLVDCGYLNSSTIMTRYNAQALDPRSDTVVTGIFNNIGASADEASTASVAKLLLDGYAAAGTVQKGGYDYHNGSRATGETQDFAAGVMIGKSFELAAKKGKDLMVYVFTDGGVTSNGTIDSSANGRGKGIWQADSGQRSSAFALIYKKDGKPQTLTRQIGAFKDNGGVDTTASKVAGSVENLTRAVVANYLALSGNEGQLAKVTGADPFGADLSKYLAFTKLR